MKKLLSEGGTMRFVNTGRKLRRMRAETGNLFKSVVYAAIGISYFFRSEKNARIQLAVSAITITAGILLHLDKTEWIVVFVCIALVFALEMLNTAIEEMCDLLTTDFHPAIKVIKDLSAGAVATVGIGSVAAGLTIFLPKIIEALQ